MLTNFKSHAWGMVTFRDGTQSRIEGMGTIEINGFPMLKIVLFIIDLKANLISIGQFPDEELMVMYTKSKCKVTKNDGSCVLRGNRSSDKCNLLDYDIYISCI